MPNTVTRKVINKALLREAMKQQDKWSYNRQLDPDAVGAIIERQDRATIYPLFLFMVHEHSAGRLVAPHYRCLITLDETGTSAFWGVPIAFYDRLPDVTITLADEPMAPMTAQEIIDHAG